MNKTARYILSATLAGCMAAGMAKMPVSVQASDFTSSADQAADVSQISLTKDYLAVNGENTISPKETFTFTVEPYGLWNVGEDGKGRVKYTKDTMPTFQNGTDHTFTIEASAGAAETSKTTELKTQMQMPVYDAVGDYWYKVTEKNNNVAGVIYGTNDSCTEDLTKANNQHDAVYYLHVQVTNGETKGTYIRTVTLHKTAPDAGSTNTAYESWYRDNHANTEGTDKKVADIQNRYYAGSLEIKKTVTGNTGDRDKLFQVKVTFTNDTDASMLSDITCKDYYDAEGNIQATATSLGWTDTINEGSHSEKSFEKVICVKDGATVSFSNIPYGVTYTVAELRPEDDKYTHEFTVDEPDSETTFAGVTLAADTVTAEGTEDMMSEEEKWNAAQATGSIADAKDTVTITNDRVSMIDIGVVTSNAPYIALLLLAGAAGLAFVHRRKDWMEE